ncbi:MAG TPA: hypothetical protein VLH81_03665 [Desulfobacterales bacterium]|nr:hypothetical protein [Desulfobacterales bacterium]
MSTPVRDETSTVRRRTPACAVCGGALRRATTGRRRRYCTAACRQRAYRLRGEMRHQRGAGGRAADPAEVTRLLAAALGIARRR